MTAADVDVVGLIRRRPILLAGAGALGLVAVRLMTGGAGETDEPADAADPAAGAGSGGSLYPGSSGGIGYDYPTVPTNGELGSPTTPTTPTTPTPPPTPPTTPKVAYLVMTVPAGTYPTFGYAKRPDGTRCSREVGSLKTGGFAAEVISQGSTPKCTGSGTRTLYLIATGAHAGKLVAASTGTITTRYR